MPTKNKRNGSFAKEAAQPVNMIIVESHRSRKQSPLPFVFEKIIEKKVVAQIAYYKKTIQNDSITKRGQHGRQTTLFTQTHDCFYDKFLLL